MSELQDAVVDWGLAQSPVLSTYDEAKRGLIAGRTNSEIIDAAGGNLSWNEALASLAANSDPSYFTGGIITVASGYRYHTFNSSGTLTFVNGDGALDVDYLVVAGGGGGGGGGTMRGAGGGGAGAAKTGTSSMSANQTVTIGAGGPGGGSPGVGSTSSLGAVSAAGGGNGSSSGIGASGGSGGGSYHGTASGGTATDGYAGGGGYNSGDANGDFGGGGGGGAGAAGASATSTTGGDGGIGIQWPASSGVYYAGGGGGGSADGVNGSTPPAGTAGSGGGGAGALSQSSVQANGVAATANTGGGGGGAANSTPGSGNGLGGTGGSGIVIVRYPDHPSYPPFAPDQVPGMLAWWDASDASTFTYSSGTIVSTWADKSSGGRDLSVASGAASRSVTINGLDAVAFDSGDDILQTADPGSALSSPITMMCVIRSSALTTGGNSRTIVGSRVGGTALAFYLANSGSRIYAGLVVSGANTLANSTVYTLQSTWNGANNSTTRYNGGANSMATGSSGTNGPRGFQLNALAGGSVGGHEIAEVCLYDSVLSVDDINMVGSYLASKWGTSWSTAT